VGFGDGRHQATTTIKPLHAASKSPLKIEKGLSGLELQSIFQLVDSKWSIPIQAMTFSASENMAFIIRTW
jgi:hypothetical protein